MFRIPCYIAIAFCCLGLLASCTQQSETKAPVTPAEPTTAKHTLMEPFHYHKLIESSPGKYFDILSWGRGKDSTGAYMILRSDSTGKQYSATNGDLEGAIIDVYNTDMNMDGYPEILIEAKAKDTTNHINIYAYEFRGTKGQKIDFPKLTSKTKKGYRGDDRLYIKEGNLIREFPVYEGNGKDAKPTGQKKILQYGLRDNNFTVKDISPVDSAAAAKPAVKEVVKKEAAPLSDKPKVSEKKSTKKKKHTEEKHKKKKRRHRE
ncbi:hypothetical protein [Mucilaginibacter paludis]|uniref:FG-GAP repeat protein n=1 Tax=Mucilaginibacter paludis DSM 18603 TaxID=714943 RepID=H1YGH5_9SPHI|nr:hypothetical protein [Mucilaginibacter paludis]EHQ24527.1 hypothetical protein Mucpa_0331 [Mucilaginibacter paludis DSM 18603]